MKNLKKQTRIRDLPLTKQPREKLQSTGRSNLSNAELLALLLSTGTQQNNALSLAETILRRFPLVKFTDLTVKDLLTIPGIGVSKAARILAALEIGQRLFEPVSVTKVLIRSLADSVNEAKEYADKRQEYLLCLYINARHELIQKEIIGIGTLNNIRIEPKEVFRQAFSTPCAGIILVHNHPSGDPSPSDDDIAFTKRIQEAGELIGVPLLDHVIICKRGYFSFRENKSGE